MRLLVEQFFEAHQRLEELVLDRDTTTFKMDVGNKFAQVVYEGKWETPLREALQAFVEDSGICNR